MSDMAGKAARARGEGAGKRPSFKTARSRPKELPSHRNINEAFYVGVLCATENIVQILAKSG